MRTVIVDDDGLVAISLKTILEAQGIEVAATGNDGKEAIELYHQYHPDVLLMDIQMKEMSGLEAAEQILIEDAEAKILFLTTFSDDEYIVKALNIRGKGLYFKNRILKGSRRQCRQLNAGRVCLEEKSCIRSRF